MSCLLLRSFRVGTLAVLGLVSVACAVEAEDDRPEPWSKTSQEQSETTDAPAPPTRCEEGGQRSCQIILDLENGVRTCWQGVQFCVEGLWTDCIIEDDEPLPVEPD